MRIPISIYGFLARLINCFVKVKPKRWVFGADYGMAYREGSKYLFEYMLKKHIDFQCTFITMNKDVKEDLDRKNMPCEYNFSLRGIITIARAEAIFTCQTVPQDIFFAYKKNKRCHYYLVHGQPYKKAFYSLPDSYKSKYVWKKHIISKWFDYFTSGVTKEDVSFVSATSSFLKPFMELDFGNLVPVKVLGMPRNDALFDENRMAGEKWVEGVEGKFVITYMPTHRKYGQGELSPAPFISSFDFQEWMRQNDVVLLVKQHPNMIPKLREVNQTDVIRDITCDRLDPQVCIYHSDVLITDFSSVWMDYLLLRRPILFYIYDNFEKDDVGCHYDIREDPPGHFCSTEEELFNLVRQCKENYDLMKPSDRIFLS